MHEGQVDYGVAGLGAELEAGEVGEGARVGCRAGFGQEGDGGGAVGEAEDLVAVFEEFVDGGAADEAGGSGDEDAHLWGGRGIWRDDLFVECRGLRRSRRSWWISNERIYKLGIYC